MKKFFSFIKETYPIIIAIVLIAAFVIAVWVGYTKETKTYTTMGEKGTGYCPICGEKLVKGVWGAYTPHFIWYCPNCP